MASSFSLLYPRGLFHHAAGSGSSSDSSSTKNHTCPMPHAMTQSPTDPAYSGYTFHQLGEIISGSAAAFAVLSISILMFRHATHLSKPNEQLKILRICMLIPIVAVLQFIGLVVPAAYFYLTPWADLMQALALGNFFLLLLEFISPHHSQREFFFSGLEVPVKKSSGSPRDGLKWYRRKWVCIFQYPLVQLGLSIATCITQAVNKYCENSSKPYFSHLWIQLIHNVSLVTAVFSCLRFYKILKAKLTGHKPLSKLFAFKLMVGINFIMGIVFWVLNDKSPSPLTPNSRMNEADMIVGIPALVNCLLMVPFSVFFHYAYDVGPYIIDKQGHSQAEAGESQYLHYQGGFLGIRAFTGMLNPGEILGAIVFAFKMYGKRNTSRGNSGSSGYPVNGRNGYDVGYGEEMNGRDHRRMDKHGRGSYGRRYRNREQ